ncbi:hypothetical protein F5Y03DRAFT_197702 [Xylaria venustula]|nr:hypothetical protein F5Y03DRAFT_197702 [Xylaria venustula]
MSNLTSSEILALIPALAPPQGTLSNFDDPASLASAARIVMSIVLALMVAFLSLRLYTRLGVTHSFGADDCGYSLPTFSLPEKSSNTVLFHYQGLCIASAATVIAYSAVVFTKLGNPLGPHQWDVRLINIGAPLLLSSLVATSLYFLASLLTKTTLLVLYLRIFRPSRSARVLIWTSIAIVILFYTISFLVDAATCGPDIRGADFPHDVSLANITQITNDYSSSQLKSGCAEPQIITSATVSVFCVITDFYVLAVPIGLMLSVRLPPRQKIGVCAIFLTGLLYVMQHLIYRFCTKPRSSRACVASIVSLVIRFQLLHSPDFTWLVVLAYLLGSVELTIGIICSCMPITFVVLNRWTDYISRQFSRINGSLQKRSDGQLPSQQSDAYLHKNGLNDDDGLMPRVPNRATTGLRSFIRYAHRSRSAQETEMFTYSGLNSIDETRHSRLVRSRTTDS